MSKYLIPLIIALVLTGCCHTRSCVLEPTLNYEPCPTQIGCLDKAFKSLTPLEVKTEWGKELMIARAFIREFDLYRAITAFKRALILIPYDECERRLEIEYGILYSYYLGKKYDEVVQTFENSQLTQIGGDFSPFKDLLIILYDSYQKAGQSLKAERVYTLIEKCDQEKADKLHLYELLRDGYIDEAERESSCYSEELLGFLANYRYEAKSVRKAQTLNAILPGAGYYYVGLHKTAFTSFAINALFTAAAYSCFEKGHVAAGIILTSLEAGWYLGGINGAGLAAKEYNQAIYNTKGHEFLVKQGLFPVLMLETTF